MEDLIAFVPVIAGLGLLIRMLVEFGRHIQIKGKALIPDGSAGKWQVTLNAVGYLAINLLLETYAFEEIQVYIDDVTRLAPAVLWLLMVAAEVLAGASATWGIHKLFKKIDPLA